MGRFWSRHWFTISLPIAFAVAWLAPGVACRGGLLRPELTTQCGVAFIFLVQGLTLSFDALRSGLLNGKLQLVSLGFVFLGFPLLGLLIDFTAGPHLPGDLRTGLMFLCVLPSTISSAPVLTATARGNAAGAICCAVMSSLLGVVLTPVWAAATLRVSDQSLPLAPVVRSLFVLIVLPLIAGQLLRLTPLRRWAERHARGLGTFATLVILFIVFAAFCDAAQGRVWTRYGARLLGLATLGTVVCFIVASLLVAWLARAARLPEADRRAAQFSAVQKSLATGVPMAALIFGRDPALGVILLPLLIYHPMQLAVQGLLAARWSHSPLVTEGASTPLP